MLLDIYASLLILLNLVIDNLSKSVFFVECVSLQRTSSTSSIGSTDGNSAQLKRVNSGSLIDFTADSQPPVAATTEQPTQQNIFLPSNGGDWASFDNVGQEKVSHAAVNAGSIESTLSQLSTLGPANTSLVASLPTSGIGASVKTDDIGQWSQVQQHQTSLFPANVGQHMNPPSSSSDPTRQASAFFLLCVASFVTSVSSCEIFLRL